MSGTRSTTVRRRPQLLTSIAELRAVVASARLAGKKIGLVPTMGALHAGHLSLVETSQAECDVTITTIFVNPTQFGLHEDFDKYPRTLDDDLAALAELSVDFVFAPDADEIYRPGSSTCVDPPEVAERLEGALRDGHFRGVTTVVLKLFNMVQADRAYFGQKDYQQAAVIRRMVDDLNVPVDVRICPIVREEDGLAMSSRNRYLSKPDRLSAVSLSKALQRAAQLFSSGERSADVLRDSMREVFTIAGVANIDYISVADRETLAELERLDGPAVALVAARFGKTRLIDNCLIG